MKNIIKIPKKDIWNWVEDESTIEIDNSPTKHDCHLRTYVTVQNDKYWQYSIEFSYNEGAQFWVDYIEATEVKPIPVTVTKWKEVEL